MRGPRSLAEKPVFRPGPLRSLFSKLQVGFFDFGREIPLTDAQDLSSDFSSSNVVEGQEVIFPPDGKINACLPEAQLRREGAPMNRTERIRQSASGELTWDEIQKLQREGWRLIALEWERDVPDEQGRASEEHDRQSPPFGLRVAGDCSTLVEDRSENEALVVMMELIIQDGPYSFVAEELNRRGYRTRKGLKWSPVSVFEMLPRLIDAGPRILSSENWHRRKQEYQQRGNPPVV